MYSRAELGASVEVEVQPPGDVLPSAVLASPYMTSHEQPQFLKDRGQMQVLRTSASLENFSDSRSSEEDNDCII